MLAWIFGKLKALFLVAAIGGPGLAAWTWWDEMRIRDVDQRGIETVAMIESAHRVKRRRGGTSYDVDLAWKDGAGNARSARRVAVSTVYAGQIIRDDKIVRDRLRIKYLADDAEATPILIEDAGRQAESDRELMWIGAAVGGIGIAGSLLFLLGGRRRKQAMA